MNVAQQLAEVRRGLKAAEANIIRFADAVSDDAWTKRPPGGGWSPAECIVHLTMTTDSYLTLFADAQARVPEHATQPRRYGRSIAARMLEWVLKPPYRMRSKTIAAFVPNANAPKGETIAAFRRSQKALLDWMSSVESLPMDQMIVSSPFNANLRYNAYAALRIMAAHQRRHLWQAERAAEGAG